MSEGWNIAVLGATGTVGEALLEALAKRQFLVDEMYALARHESAGKHLRFGSKSVIVQDAADFDWTKAQLAFNMLPLLPDQEGSVCQERRIVDEVRKILQDDGVMISVSVVQSPVFYGHAQMVSFEALRPLAAEEAREAFSRGEDIVLSEETDYPTQVGDASGNPQISIGCVHNDYGIPEQIQFWSVADNVRFGGALMAVKIAEKLVQEYLY